MNRLYFTCLLTLLINFHLLGKVANWNTPPVADFIFENACLFQPVQFTDISTGDIQSWEWDFDNGTSTSMEQDPEFTFSGDGVFSVRLVVTNSCGSDTMIQLISIANEIPTFQDTIVCNNEPVSFGGVTYVEFVPSPTVFNYLDTLVNVQGCDSFVVFRVTVNPCGCQLTFPNAFTPDGDGVNDTFQPYVVCDQAIRNYRMVIYDRWGETVYETFQYQDFWDGKINGFPMPTDVFVYLAQYEINDGTETRTFQEIKDFTLIR